MRDFLIRAAFVFGPLFALAAFGFGKRRNRK